MRKSSFLLVLLAAGIIAYGQKTVNDPNAETRNVSGFHAIEVSGGIDLMLSQGNEAVAVSAANTEYRDKIMTKVENGVLKIWFEYKKENGLRIDWGNRKLKAYVSFRNLDRLEASGGSDVDVDGTITVSKLDMGISGGSDFHGKVDVSNLKIDASGGSDVSISGKSQNITLVVSGGSDFNGYDLSADVANVQASGGSDVEITVNRELSASASGGSDVTYKGSGSIRDVKTSGSNIKKVGK
jgi:hypothetical protein